MPPDEYNKAVGHPSLQPDDFSDIGEAKVLARTCMGRLRYTSATKYIAYVGNHWDEDEHKPLWMTSWQTQKKRSARQKMT